MAIQGMKIYTGNLFVLPELWWNLSKRCIVYFCNLLDVQKSNLYGRSQAYSTKHLYAMQNQCKSTILNVELTH